MVMGIAKRLTCVIALFVIMPKLYGETETVDGITWTYTVTDGKASVGGGTTSTPAIPTSTTGSITIPSTLGGYPVASIRTCAFYNWMRASHAGVIEIRHVTPAMAREFIGTLEARMSGETINRVIALFSKIWLTLKKDDRDKAPDERVPHLRQAKISENPWADIERYETRSNTRRELTVDELGRVVSGLEGEMRLLFALGIYTGLRRGDCVLLEWSSVDMARGLIVVEPRKTRRHTRGRRIAIPISPVLATLLRDAQSKTGGGQYVMPGLADEYRAHRFNITSKITKVFESAGIVTSVKDPGAHRARTIVGFHSLRHTFVSLAANAGTPLAVVQSIVGHTSTAMTQHYYHESEEAMRGAIAALPDVYGCAGEAVQDSPNVARAKTLLSGMSEAERAAIRAWLKAQSELPL